ncbi:Ubiquitin carboxyl-terminal hydrolase 35, partial [Modicella reniformis]
ILVIHFGDSDGIGTKVQNARMFLDLPVVSRADAIRTMQESSWKKNLQIQKTSAGFRRKQTFVQPLGKVGLVNLGNSCFMNSALRALFCTADFKEAILNDTLTVDSSKVMTTRLRETFAGLSTSRLSIVTPSALYKALPEWLNDGHQQDAAEFAKLEDEDPASKQAMSSFHGTLVNQIRCSQCGTISSNKEDFYDLTIPLPRADSADLQAVVDIFPSTEELDDENNNKYFCNHCRSLQDAKRYTMLDTLPINLILLLNRFEYDTKRSRRIKIDTPISLTKSIQIKIRDGHDEVINYDLYAVVIHTGESASYGHYYTYARDSMAVDNKEQVITSSPWLLYNDTSITNSSFEIMQQALVKNHTDTPYMLFFRKTDSSKSNTTTVSSSPLPTKRSVSNLKRE